MILNGWSRVTAALDATDRTVVSSLCSPSPCHVHRGCLYEVVFPSAHYIKTLVVFTSCICFVLQLASKGDKVRVIRSSLGRNRKCFCAGAAVASVVCCSHQLASSRPYSFPCACILLIYVITIVTMFVSNTTIIILTVKQRSIAFLCETIFYLSRFLHFLLVYLNLIKKKKRVQCPWMVF